MTGRIIVLALALLALAACAGLPGPVVDTACEWVKPILVDKDDRLTAVFRRANLTHLSGGSASKIDPLNLSLMGCLLSQEAGGGDADCGDDWPDTARSSGQGEVDPRDRP